MDHMFVNEALPGLARRGAPGRRASGAGRPPALRRLQDGADHRHAVRSRASGSPAWTSAAGSTPATSTSERLAGRDRHALVDTWELFRPQRDETFVDQRTRYVDLHRPDGKPDLLQQIEQGALGLVAQHRAFGRAIHAIIAPQLHQYHHLGDGSTQTDGLPYDPSLKPYESRRQGERHARRPLGVHGEVRRATNYAVERRAGRRQPGPARLRRRARGRVPGAAKKA